jgi:hypothetical protein
MDCLLEGQGDVIDDLGTDELVIATRRGLSERLLDPFLTDHDRWVLRQFARFLSGVAPEPDPRALLIGDPEREDRYHLHVRSR